MVTLVSYNVQALYRGAAGVVGTLRGLDADVVALQEVDRCTRRSGGVDQAALLAGELGMAWAFAAAMDYDGGQYGLAVLVRGQVEGTEVLRLPRHGAEEPRIALRSELRLASSGARLVVVNTHLAADFGAQQPAALRLDQARALAGWLREGVAEAEAALLCGDLNCEPESDPAQALAAVAQPLHGRLPSYPSEAPQHAIDQAFLINGALRCEEVWIGDSLASDHRPLVVNLTDHSDG